MGFNPLVSVAASMLTTSPAKAGLGKDDPTNEDPPSIEYFQSVMAVVWLKQDSHVLTGQSTHGSVTASKLTSLQLVAEKVNCSRLSHNAPSVAICNLEMAPLQRQISCQGGGALKQAIFNREGQDCCKRMPTVELQVTSQNSGSSFVEKATNPSQLNPMDRVLSKSHLRCPRGFRPRHRKNRCPRTIESPSRRRH